MPVANGKWEYGKNAYKDLILCIGKLPLADARSFTPRGRGHVYDARCIEGRCLNAYVCNLHNVNLEMVYNISSIHLLHNGRGLLAG